MSNEQINKIEEKLNGLYNLYSGGFVEQPIMAAQFRGYTDILEVLGFTIDTSDRSNIRVIKA